MFEAFGSYGVSICGGWTLMHCKRCMATKSVGCFAANFDPGMVIYRSRYFFEVI